MFRRPRVLLAGALAAAAMRFNQHPPAQQGGLPTIKPDFEPVPVRKEPDWVHRRRAWLKDVASWAAGWRRFRMTSNFGGGAREIARRRRQIERGQLTVSNGLVPKPRPDVIQ